MIQERSYSSAIFLERLSFQNIWKKKIWFFVQCDDFGSATWICWTSYQSKMSDSLDEYVIIDRFWSTNNWWNVFSCLGNRFYKTNQVFFVWENRLTFLRYLVKGFVKGFFWISFRIYSQDDDVNLSPENDFFIYIFQMF